MGEAESQIPIPISVSWPGSLGTGWLCPTLRRPSSSAYTPLPATAASRPIKGLESEGRGPSLPVSFKTMASASMTAPKCAYPSHLAWVTLLVPNLTLYRLVFTAGSHPLFPEALTKWYQYTGYCATLWYWWFLKWPLLKLG
jgi:hypothetical protein